MDIHQLFNSVAGISRDTALYSIYGPDDNVTLLTYTALFGPQRESPLERHSGSLWVATYGNGVYRFKTDGKPEYNLCSGLVSNYCYSLY